MATVEAEKADSMTAENDKRKLERELEAHKQCIKDIRHALIFFAGDPEGQAIETCLCVDEALAALRDVLYTIEYGDTYDNIEAKRMQAIMDELAKRANQQK